MTKVERAKTLDALHRLDDDDIDELGSALLVTARLFPGFRRSPAGRQMLRLVEAEKRIRDQEREKATRRENERERSRRSFEDRHRAILSVVQDELAKGESDEAIAAKLSISVDEVRGADAELVMMINETAVNDAISDGRIKSWTERLTWQAANGIGSCRQLRTTP